MSSEENRDDTPGALSKIWDKIYGFTIAKDDDSIVVAIIKMLMKALIILLVILFSPFILIGLFIAFLAAL